MDKYTEDDYCDLLEKKICDNCGKCLQEKGVDIKAINIEEISKTIEENKFIEEEWKKENENLITSYDLNINNDEFKNAYDLLDEDFKEFNEEEYIDAFDHIEYLDDMDFNDDLTLEENTEEIFPGVRRLITKER
ncbi:MAG: hypothetical protein ACRCW0_10175 [Clostridium sp.]